MNEREEAVRELRKAIKEGTTVSGCLRALCRKWNLSPAAALDWFRAAFCLGPGAVQKGSGGYPRADSCNTQRGLATLLVLPMIVENRAKWDELPAQPTDSWFDGLTSSSLTAIDSAARATIQDDPLWANVPASVREQYLTAERSRRALSEYSEIVARLAERLQARIEELERAEQQHPRSPVPGCAEVSSAAVPT